MRLLNFIPFIISVILSCLLVSVTLFANDMIPVTVQPLKQLVFNPVKKAPAQVVTLQNSLLSSEISALVEQVNVQVGDAVSKGQVLVELECIDYELNKQQLLAEQKSLKADHEFARYQHERSAKLLKSKSVSQEDHRRRIAEMHRLAAQILMVDNKIILADKVISRCIIKAPFDGVIAERMVNVGENVAPQTPLIRLIDVENLEVEVQVPIVLVDDLDYKSLDFVYRNQHYPLKVRAVIPSIETRARHQRVRLSFINKKALPDAFGVVEITLRKLHIPANFLIKRDEQIGVFVVDGSDSKLLARFQPLSDALMGRSAEIDLPMQTQIIIEGRNALVDGHPITIQKPKSVVK